VSPGERAALLLAGLAALAALVSVALAAHGLWSLL